MWCRKVTATPVSGSPSLGSNTRQSENCRAIFPDSVSAQLWVPSSPGSSPGGGHTQSGFLGCFLSDGHRLELSLSSYSSLGLHLGPPLYAQCRQSPTLSHGPCSSVDDRLSTRAHHGPSAPPAFGAVGCGSEVHFPLRCLTPRAGPPTCCFSASLGFSRAGGATSGSTHQHVFSPGTSCLSTGTTGSSTAVGRKSDTSLTTMTVERSTRTTSSPSWTSGQQWIRFQRCGTE